MYRYKVFDLAEQRSEFGPGVADEDVYAYCECGNIVYQTESVCPMCGMLTVWKSSKIWRSKFGDPALAIRKIVQVAPTDAVGQRLCKLAGVEGFANQAEADRWRRIIKHVGNERMGQVVDFCSTKTRGRGLIAYALNYGDKIIREHSEGEPAVVDADKYGVLE